MAWKPEVFSSTKGYQQVRTRLLLDSHGEGASRAFFAIRTKPTLTPAIMIQMDKLPNKEPSMYRAAQEPRRESGAFKT